MPRQRDRVGWAEPALLILASLADGPKHGYAIIKDVEEDTSIRLGPGTLYAAISRLEESGLVAALEGDERRRPYRLTTEGETVLDDRLRAMARFARVGLSRLGVAGA
ncbi:PadR family transcriptional regulator [Streptomyces albospinus]|uniref:PadR family transcriptional regulator n=1 Tax=Streptomyces albospinus TaxID=285515 RepID=A0ABQ2VJ73_9ACTN|nr:PadR family transcriptional regulator [Streptomyces albospinus]GGU84755.1 PadR family transcriptional regulator [Streptomyces albospinus]